MLVVSRHFYQVHVCLVALVAQHFVAVVTQFFVQEQALQNALHHSLTLCALAVHHQNVAVVSTVVEAWYNVTSVSVRLVNIGILMKKFVMIV